MDQEIKNQSSEERDEICAEGASVADAHNVGAPEPEAADVSKTEASGDASSEDSPIESETPEEEISTEEQEIPIEAVAAAVAEVVTGPAIPVSEPAPVKQAVVAVDTTEAQQEEKEKELEEEDDGALPELPPERANHPWYVVHTYSGYEMRVKLGLEERIRAENVQDKFGHIVVPEEKVVELVRGEKKTSKKKVFPGYILVQCQLDDETWHLVKATPKVTGFVGDSQNPVPLAKEEVEALLAQMEGGAQRARPSVQFEQGDSVKVVDGPFADFNGTVDDVKPDKGKLRVLISIFGRNTPVELDFVQVEKV
jgi:transcriptional antiterminator NusG